MAPQHITVHRGTKRGENGNEEKKKTKRGEVDMIMRM
jgi:hypothetical protein